MDERFPQRGPLRRSGFTIVELAVAIAIAAMVSAAIATSLSQLGRARDVARLRMTACRRASDALEAIRRKAVDVINVYVCEAGGLMAATRIFQMAETAGIPCMIGSMPELGLGTAAQIHLGTAMTNLGLDSDACGVVYQSADLLKTPLRIENGFAYPPEKPGLGVEIDLDAVARYQIPE